MHSITLLNQSSPAGRLAGPCFLSAVAYFMGTIVPPEITPIFYGLFIFAASVAKWGNFRDGWLRMSARRWVPLVGMVLLLIFTMLTTSVRTEDEMRRLGQNTLLTYMAVVVGGEILDIGSSRRSRGVELLVRLAQGLKNVLFESPTVSFLGLAVASHLLLTNLCAYYIYDHLPHLTDGADQLFHAKIFALGKLYVRSHPLPQFFHFTHMLNNGWWYSQYPPGHIALLTLGVWAGAPWLINPIFSCLTLILVYRLGEEIYDKKVARLAVLLYLFSPFILFMASEYMNHVTTQFFLLLFAYLFLMADKYQSRPYAIISGLVWGYAFAIRPLTSVGLVFPWVFAIVWGRFRQNPRSIRYVFFAAMGTLLPLVLLGLYNDTTTGSPFTFGYQALYGQGHTVGFGHSGWGPPHTLRAGITHWLRDLNGLNKFVFELPVPSLIFTFFLFFFGRRKRWDFILLACVVSLSVAYISYFFHHWMYGPRFQYESAPFLILLSARGIFALHTVLRRQRRLPKKSAEALSMFALLALFFAGFYVQMPANLVLYGTSFNTVDRKILDLAEAAQQTVPNRKALVFLSDFKFRSGFPTNSPLLDTDIVYARNLGPAENEKLCRYYPEYTAFIQRKDRLERAFCKEREGYFWRMLFSAGART